MNKNSRIYIAGHTGLVGSALYRQLKREGYVDIICKSHNDLDLRNQDSVNFFFRTYRPEYVFLAAAKVGGINYNATVPADFIYDNLMIQNNVIKAAHQYGVKKLLFLGSACIYPKVTPQPIKEEYLMTAPLEPTNDAYAIAKIAGMTMAKYYTKQYGMPTISLMPANLYGPNDNFHPDRCHVIPGLINKFWNAKEKGKTVVEAWGDGSPTREFLYVDDLADACIFLMKNYNDPSHINVGSDVEITIKDLSEIIKREVGYAGSICWNTDKPNGTPRRKLDNNKLFEMGWRPKVSFDDGLARTIEWFKNNKERFL